MKHGKYCFTKRILLSTTAKSNIRRLSDRSTIFSPPYEDFKKIDRGIRNLLWSNFVHKNDLFIPSKEHPERRFFIVKSNLGFYNIIVYLNLESTPDFFSIGAFRSEEISVDHFKKLLKGMALPSDVLLALQNYYETIPFVPIASIANVTKDILSYFYPEFKNCAPVFIEFDNSNHKIQVNTQMLEEFSAEYAENYQKKLFLFLDALSKGHIEPARSALSDFITSTRFLSSQNLADLKRNLMVLNNYCHITLMGTNIHPSHVLKLYASLGQKIESLSNRNMILNMPNDICHKYYLLVKNYSFSEYSKTIRAIINYINLHLDEELSLAFLSQKFEKNATSLSASFSKEVGMSITNYIHRERINEAIRYFNTTKMTISEVSLAVGIQDFAYFSRLFHKHVGCSPREYCKNIKQ